MPRVTGNPRGQYTNPANLNVACTHGCGKTGRKGPMVTHERYHCPKRPDAQERDVRAKPVAAPAPQRVAQAPKPAPAQSELKVTRERVELRPWPAPSGA